MEDSIDRRFGEDFNEAAQLYDDDKLEECIVKARELLDDPAIPRYHRMKTLVLLGSCVGDWEEANSCCVKAAAIWRIVRRWHTEGENTHVDALLNELKVSIDELQVSVAEEEPEGYDHSAAIDDMVADHDAQVEEEEADAEAEAEDGPSEVPIPRVIKGKGGVGQFAAKPARSPRKKPPPRLNFAPTTADYSSSSMLSPMVLTPTIRASPAALAPFKPPQLSRKISQLAAKFEKTKDGQTEDQEMTDD